MNYPKKLRITWIMILVIASTALIQRPILLPFAPTVALAQGNTCPAIVKAALAAADKQCTRTGRNKVCYGNKSTIAEPQASITNLKFSSPGDIADVKAIRTLQLSALDVTANTWGVALLRLQADLPNTTPADNITVLLFGDVEMTDAAQEATTERPTQIADFLNAQASLTPTATLTVQATLAQTLTPSATPRPTATPRPMPYTYKAMQAFYFKSGSSESPCSEAPRDGILIQSPQGKQKVELSIDGARIQIGSTVFVQAQASGEMTINTLEGSATVIAFGQTQTAGTFQRVRVPLDANLKASGPPSKPEFYDNAVVQALPVKNLPQAVSIQLGPPPGSVTTQWLTIFDKAALTGCPPTLHLTTSGADNVMTSITIDPSGSTLWDSEDSGVTVYTGAGGTFVYPISTSFANAKETLNIVSPTRIDDQYVGLLRSYANCTLTIQRHLDRIDAATATP